jgi:hypothetical protein
VSSGNVLVFTDAGALGLAAGEPEPIDVAHRGERREVVDEHAQMGPAGGHVRREVAALPARVVAMPEHVELEARAVQPRTGAVDEDPSTAGTARR